jgi:hypothetical protein
MPVVNNLEKQITTHFKIVNEMFRIFGTFRQREIFQVICPLNNPWDK